MNHRPIDNDESTLTALAEATQIDPAATDLVECRRIFQTPRQKSYRNPLPIAENQGISFLIRWVIMSL